VSFAEFSPFTMAIEDVFLANLELAEQIRSVEGCVVEMGVWKGGMVAAIAKLLGPQRQYFLFDGFSGLPPAQSKDGASALAYQRDTEAPGYRDNCAADQHHAIEAMRKAGIDSYRIISGDFATTLCGFVPPPIALLRLDADWHAATLLCLVRLFDHVVSGGLIIIDDYFVWDGCSRAVHEFLAARSRPERIRHLREVPFIRKLP
jgi:O-methyltransferase